MNFKKLQKNWNDFGEKDPFWAVISWPEKKGNKWNKDDFFKLGEQEIDAIIGEIKSMGKNLNFQRCLDFGCGVGRLSQALAKYFSEVNGVDIAPSMIKLAKQYNKFGDKCHFVLNERDDLGIFENNYFDFIYTVITLQHMKPEYAKKYIKEFVRIIKPGGLIIFQLPSHLVKPTSVIEYIKQKILSVTPEILLGLYRKLKYGQEPTMEMYGTKKEDVEELLINCGGKLLEVKQDNGAGDFWLSLKYFVSK